jgi:hypothetical protein
MSLSVAALVRTNEIEITEPGQVLPALPIVLVVNGARRKGVRLDGKIQRLSGTSPGLLAVDLSRSTGFHHLEVDGQTFWFGTEDAKLRLEGVEAMLAELRTTGTGWTGQAMFSDGSGLRDAHVVYGWLDASADGALDAAEAVLAAPRWNVVSRRVLQRRGGKGVMVAPTLRLIRSDPKRYLDPVDDGLLIIDGQGYDPLRVVARRRDRTLDTPANRRVIGLVAAIARLSAEVLAGVPGATVGARCKLWRNRAESLLRRPLAGQLAHLPLVASGRQVEESTDRRYRETFRLAMDAAAGFGWSANMTMRSRFSYVDRADEVFQAYAASAVAKALGLEQRESVLRAGSLAFSNDHYDLYYDAHPPKEVLRSWRFHSDFPDISRPDLVLHERSSGRVAIIDAKYRIGPDGSATEDSRKEVSAYMSLYGASTVAILYPATGDVRTLSAKGLTIHEIPVAPPGDLSPLVPLIESALITPPF